MLFVVFGGIFLPLGFFFFMVKTYKAYRFDPYLYIVYVILMVLGAVLGGAFSNAGSYCTLLMCK